VKPKELFLVFFTATLITGLVTILFLATRKSDDNDGYVLGAGDNNKIVISSNITGVTKNSDDSYTISYKYTIQNKGEQTISEIVANSDLTKTVKGHKYEVTSVTGKGGTANSSFNGLGNKSILDGQGKLAPGESMIISVTIKLFAEGDTGPFENYAEVNGVVPGPNNTKEVVSDKTTTKDNEKKAEDKTKTPPKKDNNKDKDSTKKDPKKDSKKDGVGTPDNPTPSKPKTDIPKTDIVPPNETTSDPSEDQQQNQNKDSNQARDINSDSNSSSTASLVRGSAMISFYLPGSTTEEDLRITTSSSSSTETLASAGFGMLNPQILGALLLFIVVDLKFTKLHRKLTFKV
jgi:hypothetical protein